MLWVKIEALSGKDALDRFVAEGPLRLGVLGGGRASLNDSGDRWLLIMFFRSHCRQSHASPLRRIEQRLWPSFRPNVLPWIPLRISVHFRKEVEERRCGGAAPSDLAHSLTYPRKIWPPTWVKSKI